MNSLSSRNQYVANALNGIGVATLLFDLLTEEEEALDRRRIFDVNLLADRLLAVTAWIRQNLEISGFKIGYYRASTGAAAAFLAAAKQPNRIHSIVTRSGWPDLLRPHYLRQVTAPTLMIVGGRDIPVHEFNRQALHQMSCERRLKVISSATHHFTEAGTLEEVATLSCDWFSRHLKRSLGRRSSTPMRK